MAEGTDDSLSVEVRLELEKADRDYDEKVKKWTQPIHVPIEIGDPTAGAGARTARTFGGLTGGIAEPVAQPTTNASASNLQQQQQAAMVLRIGGAPIEGAFLGGPGLGAGGRVGTAGLNSVYGTVGYQRLESAYGSVQQLPNVPERQAVVPPVQPQRQSISPGSDPYAIRFDAKAEVDGTNRRSRDERMRESRTTPPLVTPPPDVRALALRVATEDAGPSLGGDGTPEAPFRVRTRRSRLTPPNPADFDDGSAARSAAGMAGLEAAEPTVGLQSYRRLANLSLVGAYVTAGVSAADGFVGRNQTAGDRNRLDSVADAADAAYTEARSTTGLRRSVGGLLNRLGGTKGAFSFIDAGAIDDARDTALSARAQASEAGDLRDTRRLRRSNALIGSSGFAQEIGEASIGADSEIEANNVEARANRFRAGTLTARNAVVRDRERLMRGDAQERLERESAATGGLGALASLQGANDTFGAGIGNLEATQAQRRFELERSLRGLTGPAVDERRQAEVARNAAERAAFVQQYSRASNISTQASLGSTVGDIVSRAGDQFRGRAYAISEQNQAALRSLPNFDAYSRDPNSVSLADRQRIEAEQAAGRNRIVANQFDQARTRIGQTGAAVAGGLALDFRGTESQIAANETRYREATVGMTRGLPDEVAARNARDVANRQAMQSSRLAQQSLGYSLRGESQSLDYSLGRNEIGAEAAGIAGEGINRFQSIRQRGTEFADEAELARSNTLKQLGVLKDRYRTSFRAEQIDAQNIIPANPLDSQDPTAVFDSIRKAEDEVKGAKADEGRDNSGQPKERALDSTTIDAIGAAVAKAMQSLLAS